MWYDRKNIRMLFFFGAAVALIGLVLITKDQKLIGMLLLSIAVAIIIICFTILRLHAAVAFRRRPSRR